MFFKMKFGVEKFNCFPTFPIAFSFLHSEGDP